MPQIFGFILFLCCFLLFGFCWGFLCQHSMLMPNLSLKIFSLEHFIQELQGKKGTSIKVDNTRQLILGFPPSFAVLLVILPEEHLLFSETGTFICYLHRQCFLWSVLIRNTPNGFSFFKGHYCQIPHIIHIMGLLLNFLRKNKYMGEVTHH